MAEIRELHANRRYAESIEPLRRLTESRPDDPEILFLYGVALTGAGEVTQAVWPLRRAMEHPEWHGRAAMQLANLAIATSDWDTAVGVLNPLVEEDPKNTQALLLRAYARAQTRQDYEGALADADAVLELDAQSSDALVLRAVALLGVMRIDEAGEAIQAATAHFESAGLGLAESPRFCAVRATFAKEKEELEAAEAIFDECVEKFPAQFLVVDEAAKFYDEIGRPERSLEIVRAAFDAAPGVRSYRLSLVHRLSLRGDEEEAERLMLEATEVPQPELAAAAFSDLAGYYFEREKLEESISAFARSLALVEDPGPDFLFAYADTLVAAGKYERALEVAGRMTVAPHREMVLGRVALERGRPEEALHHLSEGLKLWPDNAVARYFAATAAEQLGDFDRAIEEYRYSIRADAGASDARLRLARLYSAEGNDEFALEVVRHLADQKTYDDLRPTLFELQLLARLGRAKALPEYLLTAIRPPHVWAQAVAALAEGARARMGPAAAAKIVLQADRLDLTTPMNLPALSSVVLDLVDAGRADEALARVDAAVAANPGASGFHALRGLALVRSKRDAKQARAAFESALELDPEDAVALRGLAALEAAGGEQEAALGLYRRAIAADAEDTAALRELVEILATQGRVQEAQRDLQALLGRDPYDGAAALRLAQLLQQHAAGSEQKRIELLLRRAVRFRAGSEAQELLDALAAGAGSQAAAP